jgi:hypothetical protein
VLSTNSGTTSSMCGSAGSTRLGGSLETHPTTGSPLEKY